MDRVVGLVGRVLSYESQGEIAELTMAEYVTITRGDVTHQVVRVRLLAK